MSGPVVVAVAASGTHSMAKARALSIRLIAGLGVEGDAHAGTTVKHRSRVARDPTAPNLRQVHLIHAELHDELAAAGFALAPGELIRKAGIMAVVISGGDVCPGDAITVELPPMPHRALTPV